MATPAAGDASAAQPSANGVATGEQIEAASGVKVTRSGGASAPGALIIDIPQALGARLTPAPDKRLVEKTRDGLLPRIGPDGARAADVYARPVFFSPKLRRNAPRIALFVGGVGLDPDASEAAIAKLPAAVALGVAPYGPETSRYASEAREAGHEIWLQAPMEPFGYPSENPGPKTLLTSATDADNLEALHWLMTRCVGYVGIANYLGGKFTADQRALTPVLKDVSDRGLAYFDDGSSPRGLAREIASTLNLPLARADVGLDADRDPLRLAATLSRVEDEARDRGSAIAVATGFPETLDELAKWANGLESRGIALVPVSAMLSRGPGDSAQANP